MSIALETEKCVCCGRDTGISLSMPVELRKFFVDGCGQLCESCYMALNTDIQFDEIKISNLEMEYLLSETKGEAEFEENDPLRESDAVN